MTRTRLIASVLALVAVLTIGASSAFAFTVPNLAAVASPDQLVAVTYAGPRTSASVLEAGAFATQMQGYGMLGIPNYDPTTVAGSALICDMPLRSGNGIWAVYGVTTQGYREAAAFCSLLAQNAYVRWAN